MVLHLGHMNSHVKVSLQVLGLMLLTQPTREAASPWVSAIHAADTDGVSGCKNWPGPTLTVVDICEVK